MDELPKSARDLLVLARDAHRPPEGSRERVRNGVMLAIAAGAGIGASTAGTAVASGTGASAVKASVFAGTVGKLLLVGSVVTVIGTASLALRPAPSTPRTGKPVAAARANLESARQAKAVAMPPSAAAASDERDPTAQPSPSDVPSTGVASTKNVEPSEHTRHTTAAHEAEPAPQTDLRAEMALLSAASGALDRGELAAARAALSQHRERFAHGQLSEERRGLDVLERCMAKAPGALTRARSYLRATPTSLLTQRIEASCADKVER